MWFTKEHFNESNNFRSRKTLRFSIYFGFTFIYSVKIKLIKDLMAVAGVVRLELLFFIL